MIDSDVAIFDKRVAYFSIEDCHAALAMTGLCRDAILRVSLHLERCVRDSSGNPGMEGCIYQQPGMRSCNG